jgi:hypothetical protein
VLYLFFAGFFFVTGNNIRKQNLRNSNQNIVKPEETKGFAKFRPIPEVGGQTREQRSELLTKDYASSGMSMSTEPRTHSDVQRDNLSSIQGGQWQENFTKKLNVKVRNLSVQKCGNGGTRYVVQCTAGSEQHCYQELRKAHAVIVNELPNSDFFAVCVDTDEEKELLKTLTQVVDIEEDHVRSLSYLPERTKPVDRRDLQDEGQTVPYGITMVNAPQFWQSKGDKGGSAKVCIIDTGLYAGHEDIQGAMVSGSTSNDVVADWDSDDAGHGKYIILWMEICFFL